MKKSVSKFLALSALVVGLAAPIQSTNAAWVVGVANSLDSSSDNYELSKKIHDLAYNSAMVSFILGAITGNTIFATIFVLDENTTVSNVHTKLLETNPTLLDHTDLSIDLAKKLHAKMLNGDSVTIPNDKGFDVRKVTFSDQEIKEMIAKHGLDTSSYEVQDLIKSLQ